MRCSRLPQAGRDIPVGADGHRGLEYQHPLTQVRGQLLHNGVQHAQVCRTVGRRRRGQRQEHELGSGYRIGVGRGEREQARRQALTQQVTHAGLEERTVARHEVCHPVRVGLAHGHVVAHAGGSHRQGEAHVTGADNRDVSHG